MVQKEMALTYHTKLHQSTYFRKTTPQMEIVSHKTMLLLITFQEQHITLNVKICGG